MIINMNMPDMRVICRIGACRSMVGMGGVGAVPRMIHAAMMGMPPLREDHGVGRSRTDPSSESQCAQ
jgi:hypothetical protein